MADLCSTETTVMTPLSDDKYMDEALAEARKALQKNEIPIGAVVVADGMVIGNFLGADAVAAYGLAGRLCFCLVL